MEILFVCRGNVGRSQIAHAFFSKNSKKHKSKSAGTRVLSKTGESREGQKLKDLPAAQFVIDCMKEKGFEMHDWERKQITKEMVDEADKIIVMAEPETMPDFLKESKKIVIWEVEDPKDKNLEKHREIRELIYTKVKKLIEEIDDIE